MSEGEGAPAPVIDKEPTAEAEGELSQYDQVIKSIWDDPTLDDTEKMHKAREFKNKYDDAQDDLAREYEEDDETESELTTGDTPSTTTDADPISDAAEAADDDEAGEGDLEDSDLDGDEADDADEESDDDEVSAAADLADDDESEAVALEPSEPAPTVDAPATPDDVSDAAEADVEEAHDLEAPAPTPATPEAPATPDAHEAPLEGPEQFKDVLARAVGPSVFGNIPPAMIDRLQNDPKLSALIVEMGLATINGKPVSEIIEGSDHYKEVFGKIFNKPIVTVTGERAGESDGSEPEVPLTPEQRERAGKLNAAADKLAELKAQPFYKRDKEAIAAAKAEYDALAQAVGREIVGDEGDEATRQTQFAGVQVAMWRDINSRVADIRKTTKYGRMIEKFGKMHPAARMGIMAVGGIAVGAGATALGALVGGGAAVAATVGAGVFVAKAAKAKMTIDASRSEANQLRARGKFDGAMAKFAQVTGLARLSARGENKMQSKYEDKTAQAYAAIDAQAEREGWDADTVTAKKARLIANNDIRMDNARGRRAFGMSMGALAAGTIGGHFVAEAAGHLNVGSQHDAGTDAPAAPEQPGNGQMTPDQLHDYFAKPDTANDWQHLHHPNDFSPGNPELANLDQAGAVKNLEAMFQGNPRITAMWASQMHIPGAPQSPSFDELRANPGAAIDYDNRVNAWGTVLQNDPKLRADVTHQMVDQLNAGKLGNHVALNDYMSQGSNNTENPSANGTPPHPGSVLGADPHEVFTDTDVEYAGTDTVEWHLANGQTILVETGCNQIATPNPVEYVAPRPAQAIYNNGPGQTPQRPPVVNRPAVVTRPPVVPQPPSIPQPPEIPQPPNIPQPPPETLTPKQLEVNDPEHDVPLQGIFKPIQPTITEQQTALPNGGTATDNIHSGSGGETGGQGPTGPADPRPAGPTGNAGASGAGNPEGGRATGP